MKTSDVMGGGGGRGVKHNVKMKLFSAKIVWTSQAPLGLHFSPLLYRSRAVKLLPYILFVKKSILIVMHGCCIHSRATRVSRQSRARDTKLRRLSRAIWFGEFGPGTNIFLAILL